MGSYSERLLGITPVQDAEPTVESYSQRLLGTPAPATPTPQAGSEQGQPEQGWGEWIAETIKGKQDPQYAGTPRLTEQFRSELSNSVGAGALFGSSDAQMADIIEHQLGDKFIRREKDANGYDVFVTRGPDGQEQKGYVNIPGFEGEDVARGILGAVPYVVGGTAIGAATRPLGWGLRALAQGSGAALASISGDLAQIPLGSEQGVETTKAGITGAMGSASVPLAAAGSAVWRKFVTEPRLFNRATGKLTEKGAEVARSAGLVPEDMEAEIAKTFAQTYARTGKATEAAVKAQEGEFGIPSSAGQRSKDPWHLTQEEAMRRNLYGEKARDTMQAFDKQQAEAVDFAARTRLPTTFRAETGAEAGTMNPKGLTDARPIPSTSELGEGIQGAFKGAREAAKEAEGEAWDSVGDMLPRTGAFALLPDSLAGKLGGLRVTSEMPKAAGMARALDDYIAGKAFQEPVAGVLKQTPVKTVDEMRRQLLAMYKGASDPTDAMAAKAIYDGYNDWIKTAAEKTLLEGAPEAAANLRIARDFTREMHEIFEPAIKGKKTPAARLMGEMASADSPERAVQVLFGPASAQNPSTIKNGAVEAVRHMKTALQRYGDPRIAADTIGDMKLAYWARLVQNKQGNVHTPGVMLSNIRAALANQGTLVRELFSPQEIAQMQRLAQALETITYKPPNASGSGYTAANLAKQFFGKIFDAFGLRSVAARTALEYSGLPNKYGAAAASRAVNSTPRTTPQEWAPVVTPAGAQYGRDQRFKN